MTLWRMVVREIALRRLSFALGVVSVAVAVGVFIAELTLLEAHDLRTQDILAAKEAHTREAMQALEEDYRRITVKMGFNVLILPEGQELADFYSEGYASAFMPEAFATRLAESGIMSIQHLLPSLEQKIRWPEQKDRTIILVGIRGEVPILPRDDKKPILLPVPPGKMVVGHELARTLDLKVGDRVRLMGREFEISQCHSERGTKDDITAWIDLAQAQELLGRRGQINAILALKCHCVGVDLGTIRREIPEILPGTQVIELASNALARAEARDRAAAAAQDALAAEHANRARLRHQHEAFAAWFVPLVIVGCMAWIALLALGNVRERRSEIGILRALGLRSRHVLFVFLSRPLLLGTCGAVTGCLVGFGIGVAFGEVSLTMQAASRLFHPGLLVGTLLASPLLAVLASWIPAMLAVQQDPAVVLREE